MIVYATLDLTNRATNPLAKFGNFASILNLLIPLTTGFGAIIFLIMMFWGGITILTAGGNKERFDSGRKTLTFAVVGLIIVFVAFLIVQLITYIFKFDIFPV